MNKICFLLLALLLALAPLIGAEAGENYNLPERGATGAIVGGLPLMPGLALREEEGLILFGAKRTDRSVAFGYVDVDEVYTYYAEKLRQAGWEKITARLFKKAGQELHLEAKSSNENGVTVVEFTLIPAR